MTTVIAVTPKTVIRTSLLFLGLLISLLICVWLVWFQPGDNPSLMGYRSYRATPLEEVVKDLESHHVIPAGTPWESDELKHIPITTHWLAPKRSEALQTVALSANVEITYSALQHGVPRCPIHIARATSRGAGVKTDGHRQSADGQCE